ncbi:hypothetical protein OA249_01320 [Litorivicinus sp.]|nr:hypothetical protein [Litorivicinus sp.]
MPSSALLGTAIQIAEAYTNGFGMQTLPLEIGVPAGIAYFLATSFTMAFMERAGVKVKE